MGKKIQISETVLKKIIKESVLGEISKEKIMPSKYREMFTSRVRNAAHGSMGDVEKAVKEFYYQFKDRIPNEGFTPENLLELAEKIEDEERSGGHGNPGANRQGFSDGWWGGNWGKSLEENRKSVKLSEGMLKKVISESVKKVLKESLPKLPGYDRWKTSIPDSWDQPDKITKEDFYDMVNTEGDDSAREFIGWLKDYDSEICDCVIGAMQSGKKGKNPFLLAIDCGLDWGEIAQEYYDMKPVDYYPGDLDENKGLKKKF